MWSPQAPVVIISDGMRSPCHVTLGEMVPQPALGTLLFPSVFSAGNDQIRLSLTNLTPSEFCQTNPVLCPPGLGVTRLSSEYLSQV